MQSESVGEMVFER